MLPLSRITRGEPGLIQFRSAGYTKASDSHRGMRLCYR